MKISIAMATYNGAKYLPEQLQSFLDQSRLPDEIIITDDGSTDGTLDILSVFQKKIAVPVSIYRNSKNLGSTKNFEKALRLCTGDILILSDQDDVWDRHKIRAIENCFENHSAAVGVLSNAALIGDSGQRLGGSLWQSLRISRRDQWNLQKGGERAFNLLLRRNLVTGAAFAFRSKYLEQMLPFPESWVHDAWIALLLSTRGSVYTLDLPLFSYRQHENNQIGIKVRPIREKASDHESIGTALNQISYIMDKVSASREFWPEYVGLEIQAKLVHLQKRKFYKSKSLGRRLALIFEYLPGRYHRYSNGSYSFIKDVLRFH